jgi:hypothetical protein
MLSDHSRGIVMNTEPVMRIDSNGVTITLSPELKIRMPQHRTVTTIHVIIFCGRVKPLPPRL